MYMYSCIRVLKAVISDRNTSKCSITVCVFVRKVSLLTNRSDLEELVEGARWSGSERGDALLEDIDWLHN